MVGLALALSTLCCVFRMIVSFYLFLFSFLWWGETESTWFVGHYLAYCTISGWEMMMNMEQSVEWELAGETEVLGENLPQWQFRMLVIRVILHEYKFRAVYVVILKDFKQLHVQTRDVLTILIGNLVLHCHLKYKCINWAFIKMYCYNLNLITLAFSNIADSNFCYQKFCKSECEPLRRNMNIVLSYAVWKCLHSPCTQRCCRPATDFNALCHASRRMNNHPDDLTSIMNYLSVA
jgi:hypothetical protein